MLPSLLVALAVSTPFDTLVESAESIPHLDSFLASYIGDCREQPPDRGPECREEASQRRKQVAGRTLRIAGDSVSQVTVRSVDESTGRFRLRILPFWSAGGRAMSRGKPTGVNRSGAPLVRTMDIEFSLSGDEPAFMVRRKIEQGRVDITWVVVPGQPWKLSRKGEDPIEGVAVRVRGLRIADPRSGRTLWEKVWK